MLRTTSNRSLVRFVICVLLPLFCPLSLLCCCLPLLLAAAATASADEQIDVSDPTTPPTSEKTVMDIGDDILLSYEEVRDRVFSFPSLISSLVGLLPSF